MEIEGETMGSFTMFQAGNASQFFVTPVIASETATVGEGEVTIVNTNVDRS